MRWIRVTFAFAFALSLSVAMAHADCGPPSALIWGSAGTGPGNFATPWGVAIGLDGTIYVTDEGNDRIQKFTPAGVYIGEWLTGPNTNPVGISIDESGNVWVTLHHVHQVAEYTPAGALIAIFGSGDSGPAQLGYPVGIAVHAGKVYVASSFYDRLQVFNTDGSYVTGWGVSFPYGVQLDAAQNVYVSSYNTFFVYEFTNSGSSLGTIGGPGTGPGQFEYPVSMAFDGFGNLFVIDGDNDRVQEFSAGGSFLCSWGTAGTGAGQLSHPTGIALGPNGSVYVAEWGNDRIQLFANQPVPVEQKTWGSIKASYRR
jgi:sugar lactone lactonase YvrE